MNPHRIFNRHYPTAVRSAFRALVLLLCLLPAGRAHAQRWAAKTNLAYWATSTPNLGAEAAVADRWTIDLAVGYNPFTLNASQNRKLKHVLVMPEARYWLCHAFQGHFLGVHTGFAHYNLSRVNLPPWNAETRRHRYQGNATGVGLSYGYEWILGRRWNLEAEVGVGYVYSRYKQYDCVTCGAFHGQSGHHYFGPTKLAVSVVYMIK